MYDIFSYAGDVRMLLHRMSIQLLFPVLDGVLFVLPFVAFILISCASLLSLYTFPINAGLKCTRDPWLHFVAAPSNGFFFFLQTLRHYVNNNDYDDEGQPSFHRSTLDLGGAVGAFDAPIDPNAYLVDQVVKQKRRWVYMYDCMITQRSVASSSSQD